MISFATSCPSIRLSRGNGLLSCPYSKSVSESTGESGSSALIFSGILILYSACLSRLLKSQFAEGSNALFRRSMTKTYQTRDAMTRARFSILRIASCMLTSPFAFTWVQWRWKLVIFILVLCCCGSEIATTIRVSLFSYMKMEQPYHNGQVPETFNNQGSIQAGWYL